MKKKFSVRMKRIVKISAIATVFSCMIAGTGFIPQKTITSNTILTAC